MIRQHVWVTPYYEEDLAQLADTIGVEHMLFGSDWPHGEGLAEPVVVRRRAHRVHARRGAAHHPRQLRRARRPLTHAVADRNALGALDEVRLDPGCVAATRHGSCAKATAPARSNAVNDRVYIHEFIDIIGHNRANYMQHMTANWSPIGQEERNQLCYGVWALIGSTGAWPKTVNMWEHEGWSGLAASFATEAVGTRRAGSGARASGGPRRPSSAAVASTASWCRRRGRARSRSSAPPACAATSTRTSS